MKKQISGIHIAALLLLSLFIFSCNTYKWQRKRYYKGSKSKNWNNYNPDKAKQEEEQELKKYYRK